MEVRRTALPGVLVIEPRVHRDRRGFFLETWRQERYAAVGVRGPFVQDNVSLSVRGTLRGLHYQHPRAQGKLVYVLQGEVFDVAVDIRRGSPSFGRWVGEVLSGENARQLWVPPGFAHGFCVLSERALFAYKCTEYYAPEDEGGVRWDDPGIGIGWPLREVLVSERDGRLPRLEEIAPERLPEFRGGGQW